MPPPTVQQKSVICDRLTREGRYAEAMEWKEQRRLQLRNQRYSRTQALEKSWKDMEDMFPPLPEPPPPPLPPPAPMPEPEPEKPPRMEDDDLDLPDDEDDFEFPEDQEQSAEQMASDCRWVYRNIARKKIQKKDCPSAGAWGLLGWARKNPGKFYEQIVVKIASGKLGASDSSGGDKTDGDTSEIDALLVAAKKTP